MFARVSIIEGKPEHVDEGIRNYRNNVIPAAKKNHGFKDAYLLVDRKTGKVMSITMWETEKDVQSSTETANQLRSQAAQIAGSSQPPKVEIYEVAVSGVLATA
jgi:heme-degrading monooxygenase HmoA